MTKRASNILILLVSTLASLIAAELLLRVMPDSKSLAVGTTRTTRAQWYGWAMEANAKMPFVNPDTGVRTFFTTNSQGWKDVEHALAKPPGAFRILVLGDSYTYGMVPKEELYTR